MSGRSGTLLEISDHAPEFFSGTAKLDAPAKKKARGSSGPGKCAANRPANCSFRPMRRLYEIGGQKATAAGGLIFHFLSFMIAAAQGGA